MHQGLNSAVFSPSSERLVTTNDRIIRIWDAITGIEIAVLRGHEDTVNWAEFSPDGMRIVSASLRETVLIWEAFPKYEDLFKAATEVVDRLDPLTTAEECEYYLRTEGCKGP